MTTARGSEPRHQMLARDLRARIAHGDFSGGQQLPTESELVTQYEVSRQTVRRAFQDLVAEGMVYRVRGRGTFVKPSSDGYVRQVGTVDDLMGLSDDTLMEVVEPLNRQVDPVGAGRLRLTSDVVYRIRFVRKHDAIRFCATTVVLPPRIAHLLDDVEDLHVAGAATTMTIIGLLDKRLGTPIAEAQQSITVERVPAEDAAALGCPPDHPTLRADRLYLDSNGECVELAVSHFLPEHYSYRISLRRNG